MLKRTSDPVIVERRNCIQVLLTLKSSYWISCRNVMVLMSKDMRNLAFRSLRLA